jgi:anti-sigma factor RsiW
MREQHLSDEAIAAYADDVLPKHARERARRHTAACPECNYAVAVQREAVWALRAAPAPSLPIGLLDRLREVPATTPIRHVPSAIDEHGNAMFATFSAPAAAFVPQSGQKSRGRMTRPVAMTAASLAVVGVLAGAAVMSDSHHSSPPSHIQPASVWLPVGPH